LTAIRPASTWRRSSRCETAQCVEIKVVGEAAGDRVLMRDSKDPEGRVLTFSAREWVAFLASLRGGDLGDRA
jgi:hypothetical protein